MEAGSSRSAFLDSQHAGGLSICYALLSIGKNSPSVAVEFLPQGRHADAYIPMISLTLLRMMLMGEPSITPLRNAQYWAGRYRLSRFSGIGTAVRLSISF